MELSPAETAIIINRVSTVEQELGYSLTAQRDGSTEYANNKNLNVIKIFDIAESARGVKNRKQFRQAINFAIENKIENVIVEKTDRLARNLMDTAWVQNVVKNNQVKFHFWKENIILEKNSSSHTKLQVGFKSLIAQFYSDNNAEEVKKGKLKKAESGQPPTKAWGYRWVEKKLEPHPVQAIEYTKMVDLYLEHKSLHEVAEAFNAMGIKPPRGEVWHFQSVWRVLNNRLYLGYFEYLNKTYKGAYQPLIDQVKWEKLQKILRDKSRKKARKHNWLLAGMLTTEKNKLFSAEIQKGIIYYSAKFTNKRIYLRETDIIEQIDSIMLSVAWTPEFYDNVKEISYKILEESFTKNRKEEKETEKKINAIKQKEKKLVSLYLEDNIELDVYNKQRQKIKKEKVEVLAIEKKNKKNTTIIKTKIEDIAKTLLELDKIYENANTKNKIAIVKQLSYKIEIDADKNITMYFAPPYNAFLAPVGYKDINKYTEFENSKILRSRGFEPLTF